MRQILTDYGYKLRKVSLLCDNESAIHMLENPVEHGHIKHIDIWYHFLRDHSQRRDIVIDHVSTHKQWVDIFTNPLDEKRFCELRNELNVLDSRNLDWNIAHIAHFIPLIMACLFHLVQIHIFLILLVLKLRLISFKCISTLSLRLKGKWSWRQRQSFYCIIVRYQILFT